jgi:hypothetical protein
MFRHLDSNQDNGCQRPGGCQLPYAGQKPQTAAAERQPCSYSNDTGQT